MTSRRYLIGILGLLLLSSISSAYNLYNNALYCTNCADCTNALNNDTYNITYLNGTISGAAGDCINEPENASNKIFDCNISTISGSGLGYGIDIRGIENMTIRNCDVSGFGSAGISIAKLIAAPPFAVNITILDTVVHNNTRGVYLQERSINCTISNVTSYNNSRFGFGISDSYGNNFINSNTYDNGPIAGGGHGFHIMSSGMANPTENNTFTNCRSYNNTADGYFVDTNTADDNVFDNCTAENNTLNGFHIYDADRINITDSFSYLNSQHGVFINTTSNDNYVVNGDVYDNTGNGVYIYGNSIRNVIYGSRIYRNANGTILDGSFCNEATDNMLINNLIYDNNENAIWVYGDLNNFTNNTIANNTGWGFFTSTCDHNAVDIGSFYDNAGGGINVESGSFNNFSRLVMYNNSASGSTNIVVQSGTSDNRFDNIFIYNDSAYIYHANIPAETNFTNLTIGYNSTIGLVNWNFVNITGVNLNSSNFLVDPYFVSLNDSNATDFNKSANITIYAENWYTVHKRTGFPTTRNDIINNGSPYTPLSKSWSNGVLRFGVPGFSGYAAKGSCFYADTPDTLYNITANLTGNKSDSICITINASNVTIQCNDYNVTGNYVGSTYGIRADDVENITIMGCNVRNYSRGVYLNNTNYSDLVDITAYNNFQYGFLILTSSNNNLTNNTAYNHSQSGFHLIIGSNYSNLINNLAYDNNGYGFFLSAGSNTNFINNTAHDNTNGLGITTNSVDNNLINNTAYGNSQYGLFIHNSNNTNATHNHLYNNMYDLHITTTDATPRTVYLYNVTIDNPLGNFENYTSLTITDLIDANTAYSINWTAVSAALLPTNYISFAEKFINITAQVGTVIIDSITWHWTDAEVTAGGYNESLFVLSQYNASGWTHLNNTPDTTGNTLSLTNLNPASDYGILQNNTQPEYCMIINASGTYQLNGHAVGAPYNASELAGMNWACVKIAVSDVVFDCAGYNITNNGTSSAVAIAINGSAAGKLNNITVRNCPSVSNYTIAAYYQHVENSTFRNLTIHNNTNSGLFLYVGFNNTVVDNTIYGHSAGSGFYIGTSSTNNTIINNIGHDNLVSFNFASSEYNDAINNTAHDDGQDCFMLQSGANYNLLVNNTAYACSQTGFDIRNGAHDNNLINNTAYDNAQGFYVWLSSPNNTLINNTAYGNSNIGFYMATSDGTIIRNAVSHTNLHGIALEEGSTTVENVHLYNNSAYEMTMTGAAGGDIDANITNATIDNPSGNFQNYTSLTLFNYTDTGSGEGINIKWNPEPAVVPGSHFSFLQKYVNITEMVLDTTIPNIRFNWYGAEVVPPYDEAKFEVWEHNGTWSKVSGQVLNTAQNYIEVQNLNPSSTYGILQNNLSQCMIINAPGHYEVKNNLQGAPIDASEIAPGTHACIKIGASDVLLDCNNYNVTNNGTGGATIGILLNGSLTNVTVANCWSSNYTHGIYTLESSNNTLINNTAYYNTEYGFVLISLTAVCTGNNLLNNTAHHNTGAGFLIQTSSGNNLTNNTAYNNDGYGGIWLYSQSDGNRLSGNRIYNSNGTLGGGRGIFLQSSSGNTLINNIVNNNSDTGIYMYSSSENNTLINNTAYNNTHDGFFVAHSFNTTFYDNKAYNNSWYGFEIISSTLATLRDNVAYNNQFRGFFIVTSNFTNMTNSTAYDNAGGIEFTDSHFNTVNSPNLYLNNKSGGYEINFDSSSDRNNVTDAYLWRTTNYLNQGATAAFPNNMINFSIAYDANIGIINWALLSITDITLDSTTVLPRPTFVSIDSVSEPEANSPANVTIYTPLCPNPTIYTRTGFPQTRADILANGTIYTTTIQSCVGNIVTFDAYTFSGYSSGNYSNLTIWDSNDAGSTIYTWQPATFYANYSNSTSGAPITNVQGSCFMMANDSATVYAMNYNAVSGFWEYSKAFSNPGNYTWNVTCNSTVGYDTLFAEDDIPVLLGCFWANSAGTYTLSNDLGGNKSDRACITVNASNVVIDCAGYNIVGNVPAPTTTMGIYANGHSNVVVRNCNVSNYTTGYYLVNVFGASTIEDDNATANFQCGFNVTNSTGVTISDNSVTSTGVGGTAFDLLGNSLTVRGNYINESVAVYGIRAPYDGVYGTGNTFEDNVVSVRDPGGSGIGFFVAGVNLLLDNNTALSNSFIGMVCGDDPSFFFGYAPCSSSSIYNNTVHLSGVAGIVLVSGNTVDILDNDAFDNSLADVYVYNSTTVTISGNEMNTSFMGVGLDGGNDIGVVNGNRIYGHTFSEIYTMVNLTNIRIEENVDAAQTYFTLGAGSRIDDLYLLYNYSDANGRVHFPIVNSSVDRTLDNTNFLLTNTFVSLNDSNAPEFNVSADVILYTDVCPVDVYRLGGFPQNRDDIVENGSVYAPTHLTCVGNSADFGVTSFSGYAVNKSIAPPPPPPGGKPKPKCISVELYRIDKPPCPGDYVYFGVGVTSPIKDARVVIKGPWPWSDVKYTDESGEVFFKLYADGNYKVFVDGGKMEDYCSDTYEFDYTLCECNTDDDCEDDEICVDGECVPVECECGEVYDHECHEYECCADDDCLEGYVCENHECIPVECESDAECADDEYCEGGECIKVPLGECGFVENHTWYDYECCEDEDCPPEYLCWNNECVLYKIETDETGYVGDDHGVQVYPEGGYQLTLTDPDGRQFTITTDENGYAVFVLENEGNYGISLIEENKSLATVSVNSLQRPLPPEEEKPVVWLDELLKYFWWLVIVLLLIIGYILFKRRKKKRYHVGK